MVYCNIGILEKEGLSWEVGGVWEKCKRHPGVCLGMKGLPGGGGRGVGLGRLVSFYVFHVIFKMNKWV